MNLNRAQRIKFLAEKLAVTANAENFTIVYLARANAYGTPDYDQANRDFRYYMQAFIDQARVQIDAENKAYWSAKHTTQAVDQGDQLADEDEDEDDDEAHCESCGKLLTNEDDEVCAECADEDE